MSKLAGDRWRLAPAAARCAFVLAVTCGYGLPSVARASDEAPMALANPILFVTQVPVPADFATIGSVFANHLGNVDTAARGGDLWIRYANGILRNLTQEAGFGSAGLQGAGGIAVRDPAVNFDGTKAVFSMVVGAPTEQYQQGTWYWQLYEITGFGTGQTIAISRIANQPPDNNNVEPVYASDGSVIFASDRPRNGQRHLYPQLDEYESAATTTGLWKLDPATGALTLVQHSPSGSFGPLIDSYGRLLFTRWDHMQTDQQAAADADAEGAGGASIYGTFDYASEAANAAHLPRSPEVYPEPLYAAAGSNLNGHRFNFFFPWQLNQDGTTEETLNHVGRHELQSFFERSFTDDPALEDFIAEVSGRPNANAVENLLQLAEDPLHAGRYYAIDAPEFYTHGSGQLVSIDAAPDANAAGLQIQYHSPRNGTGTYDSMPAGFAGRYRNPLPMADGQLIAVHTDQWAAAYNTGTRPGPQSNYAFRLQRLSVSAGQVTPAEALTGGITKSISYWDPDVLVSYDGPLWELSPVEVRSRAVPPNTSVAALSAPEVAAFAAAGVDPDAFRAFLRARNLGVLVSRNVTARDAADDQQPYNLHVPGGAQTLGNGGRLYDIAWMQFFEGDQVRGMGGAADPSDGRRVIARPLHDADAFSFMPPTSGAPPGSVEIAVDGSVAAIVPARRAMTWQTTGPTGDGVVRERYWLNVQPGEVRACDGCHGVNHTNQAGAAPAQNTPAALVTLLEWWRDHGDAIFGNGFD